MRKVRTFVRVSVNANYPRERWEAYGELFEVVKQKKNWSQTQLLDEIRADAIKRGRIHTYSPRGIDALKKQPKKGERARKPHGPRLKHLHEFFSEKINELGLAGKIKAEDFAQRLAAIAPPPRNEALAARPERLELARKVKVNDLFREYRSTEYHTKIGSVAALKEKWALKRTKS